MTRPDVKQRSTYYVQLEDDVLTKKNFVKTMRDAASEWSAQKRRWFVIDFCQLGFIGKLFKSTSLPVLIQFFLAFYNDKPVDWLLMDVIQTMVCAPSQNANKCKEEREQLKIQYKPSLFQHIGTHSSLKGKVRSPKKYKRIMQSKGQRSFSSTCTTFVSGFYS